MIKVLVCGGRDYADREKVYACLDRAHKKSDIAMLIHGGADGADKLAGEWAKDRDVWVQVVEAEWKKYGPAAGPRRNQEMLDIFAPDGVVAFPGGKGTADMVARAKRAGVPVWQIN